MILGRLILLITLMLICASCSQEKAVDPIDSQSGTYKTFNLYVGSQAWEKSYLKYRCNKTGARGYCRNQNYESATQYSGQWYRYPDPVNSDRVFYLNKVTCWKP